MYDRICRACQATSTNMYSIGNHPEIQEFYRLVELKTFDDTRLLCEKCKDFTMEVINFIEACRVVEENVEADDSIFSVSFLEETIETEEILESCDIIYEDGMTQSPIEVLQPENGIISEDSCKLTNFDIVAYDIIEPVLIHSMPTKRFHCDYCGSSYRRKDTLKQHLLSHRVYPGKKGKEGIHKCSQCKAEFFYLWTYKNHVNTVHSQERPYKCKLCQKSYKRRDSLDSHMLMHKNNRNFRCSICNSSFNRQSDLKYHLRVHKERKLFSCHLCQANYVSQTNLKLHLATIHEDKRPFSCQNCGFAFRKKATMMKHVNAMTCFKKIE